MCVCVCAFFQTASASGHLHALMASNNSQPGVRFGIGCKYKQVIAPTLILQVRKSSHMFYGLYDCLNTAKNFLSSNNKTKRDLALINA